MRISDTVFHIHIKLFHALILYINEVLTYLSLRFIICKPKMRKNEDNSPRNIKEYIYENMNSCTTGWNYKSVLGLRVIFP